MDIEFSYQTSGGWRDIEDGMQVDGPLWACQIQHEGMEAFAISTNDEIEALDFALRVLRGEGPYPPEPIKAPIELTDADRKWWSNHYHSKYDVVSVVHSFRNDDGSVTVVEI